MLVWAILAAVAVFLAVLVLTLLWARKQVAVRKPDASRQHLLALAAYAASDASGKELLTLMDALDQGPADSPVTVQWVPRPSHDGKPAGMLVKITWDGNEWRRIMDREVLRTILSAHLEPLPPERSPRARQLLADLEAAP